VGKKIEEFPDPPQPQNPFTKMRIIMETDGIDRTLDPGIMSSVLD
jgi:hypothetical protein